MSIAADAGAAWERFQAGEEPGGVRGDVLTSWRRSRGLGVDPEHVEVPFVETELDTPFARVAVPIMARTAELLVGERSCLALADAAGRVLWRWVSEPPLRSELDRLSVAQGFCFDEGAVGTNGLGTALETGGLAVVRGSEHFVHRFHGVTCVAAPVRHPITRRTLGAVNLTCRAADTNPLLPVVVGKLVDEVQAALLAQAGGRERQLLDAYLAARREGRGPVLTVGDGVVIGDADVVGLGFDAHALWDEIRAAPDDAVVELPADLGTDLTARVRLVREVGTVTGAVLRLVPGVPAAPRPSGPARRSRWAQLVTEARALVDGGPLLVTGEPGTGKATLLAEVLPDAVTASAARCAVDGVEAWAAACAAHPDLPLVLHHVEELPAAALRALDLVLARRAPGAPLAGTCTEPADDRIGDALGALFAGRKLTVPPLRRRGEEIAGLAAAELARHDPGLVLDAGARHALSRHHWPGNHRELAATVRSAAGRARAGIVGAAALPARVRAAGARRVLSPLERAEADVIAAVLAECAGNKSAAARELGISRTALYAKLRAYRL